MRTLFRTVAVAFLTALTTTANADTLTEALFQGQVQQSFDGNKLASCGVVIAGLELANSGNVLMFNGSFALHDLRGGLVKGSASEIPAKLVGTGDSQKHIRHLRVEKVWFKGHGAPRTTVLEGSKANRGEDPRFVLYATELESLSGVLQSISDKQPIQIGVRVAGRKFDQVLFGVVNLSDAQFAQLSQCIVEWSKSILDKHKANQ